MMPFTPVTAVRVISSRGKPWSRMITADTTTARRNASMGLALPTRATAVRAKPITTSTGKRKFQKRLVFTPS